MASIGFAGVALGALVHRGWLVVPAAVTAFLLQHAIQGWCQPVPFFRRRGVRTADEIAAERYALKALRGDFESALDPGGNGQGRARAALQSVYA